jgi:hypothetical protein
MRPDQCRGYWSIETPLSANAPAKLMLQRARADECRRSKR